MECFNCFLQAFSGSCWVFTVLILWSVISHVYNVNEPFVAKSPH